MKKTQKKIKCFDCGKIITVDEKINRKGFRFYTSKDGIPFWIGIKQVVRCFKCNEKIIKENIWE